MKTMTALQAQQILICMGTIDAALDHINNLVPSVTALTAHAKMNNAEARQILLSVALSDIGVETVTP